MKVLVKAKRLAIAFLALTATVVIGGVLWISRPQDAFSYPIQLRHGFSLERQFHVSATALYRIEVHCSRVIPFQEMKELLEKGNLVEVRLLKDGGLVEMHHFPGSVSPSLPATLGFADKWISQDMATFMGDPKATYTITCSVIKPIDELNSTHPTLLVTLDPVELERGAIGSLLLLVVFLILAALSVVFGTRFFKLHRRLGQT